MNKEPLSFDIKYPQDARQLASLISEFQQAGVVFTTWKDGSVVYVRV